MSITNAHRVALRADLATVAGLTIHDEEVELAKRGVTPCAEMLQGGIGTGESDPEANTNAGTCSQRVVEVDVRLTVANETAPWTAIADLIDSVINAIESPTSNMKTTVAGIGWVVCGFDAPGRAEGASDGITEANISVRFSYEYAQGSM